jgi:hypothetical protein
MKKLRSQKGEMTIGDMVFYAVVVIGIYIGISMAIPWAKYFQVQELFRVQAVQVKKLGVEKVREDVNRKLKEMNVELFAEDDYQTPLIITFERGKPAVIEGSYKAEVTFITGHKYIYTFHPRKEAPS